MSGDYIICVLQSDMPEPFPGSEERWCSICAEPVWISQAGLSIEDARPVCWECAPGLPQLADAEPQVTPQTREELHQAGLNDDQIETMRKFADRILAMKRKARDGQAT